MSLKVQYSSLQTGIKVQLNFTPADPTFNFPLPEYSFVIVFQVNLLSVNQLKKNTKKNLVNEGSALKGPLGSM